MGFDEAKETVVGILIVIPTSDPESEAIVFERDHPAPVFCNGLQGLESFFLEALAQKLRQAFAVSSGADLVLFTFVGRESVRTKFDMRLHHFLDDFKLS